MVRGFSQHSNDLIRNVHRSAQNIGLPDAQHGSTGLLQQARLLTIALNVPPNLGDPIGDEAFIAPTVQGATLDILDASHHPLYPSYNADRLHSLSWSPRPA